MDPKNRIEASGPMFGKVGGTCWRGTRGKLKYIIIWIPYMGTPMDPVGGGEHGFSVHKLFRVHYGPPI